MFQQNNYYKFNFDNNSSLIFKLCSLISHRIISKSKINNLSSRMVSERAFSVLYPEKSCKLYFSLVSLFDREQILFIK